MSEQARGIRHEAVPQGAQGLHYNKGIFSEVLVYYEAIYFETRGENSRHASNPQASGRRQRVTGSLL
jgi:hypothetical protein